MENSKRDRIYKVIMLVIITAVLTFMVTSIGMYNYYTKTNKGTVQILSKIDISEDTTELDKKIEIVKKYLKENYIGDLDFENMQEQAIKGYVDGVKDDYTEYMTKDEYEDLLVSVTGDYVGIGIYMYQDEKGNIVVLTPMEGSPAQEAGLQPNDIIVSINGEECRNMDSNIASSKIKGIQGTTVELEILREGQTIKTTIERRKIEIADSYSKVLEENIGYIQLTTFDEGCSENIKKYIKDFESKGIKSTIIDLRNNTGGIVTEAINFSEIFLNEGDTIMCSYDKKQKETVIKSQRKKETNMRIVLLVNGYSASATEIVSSALQDNDAATLVGTKTYGKGVMQEIFPLFSGALKITIEEFKTPKGNKINREGITPDIIVEDNVETEDDEQLQKAIEICKQDEV